jgi:flagellar biosynthetic protein FliQ
MGIGQIVSLMRSGVVEVFTLAAPALLVALVVGLVIAIFQATTSIQEQTLTTVPKIFAILGVLALLSGWMFAHVREYTIQIFNMIPNMAR